MHTEPPKWTFFGRLHFDHWGCCPLKFLYTLHIEQGYIAHTTKGRGPPPQKKLFAKFKIWPKIERVRPYNFATSGGSLTKLFQTTYCEGGVITGVPFLEVQPPKIWGGNVQISARFLITFDFDREYLQNGSTYRTSEKNLINRNPFHVGGKKFGEL